jgi:hypothetical protein
VAERKPFLLRMDPELLAALQKWASDELRSLNGQIEFLLREDLREAGRLHRGETKEGAGKTRRGEPQSTAETTERTQKRKV